MPFPSSQCTKHKYNNHIRIRLAPVPRPSTSHGPEHNYPMGVSMTLRRGSRARQTAREGSVDEADGSDDETDPRSDGQRYESDEYFDASEGTTNAGIERRAPDGIGEDSMRFPSEKYYLPVAQDASPNSDTTTTTEGLLPSSRGCDERGLAADRARGDHTGTSPSHHASSFGDYDERFPTAGCHWSRAPGQGKPRYASDGMVPVREMDILDWLDGCLGIMYDSEDEAVCAVGASDDHTEETAEGLEPIDPWRWCDASGLRFTPTRTEYGALERGGTGSLVGIVWTVVCLLLWSVTCLYGGLCTGLGACWGALCDLPVFVASLMVVVGGAGAYAVASTVGLVVRYVWEAVDAVLLVLVVLSLASGYWPVVESPCRDEDGVAM
ncbi:hypothetical protein CAC42_6377 [Sphaceloma murrayae]|uniref:Transmembrane protein n=1 Tax=Sphaceloma murrayae TaxID=2082308 RepID=A0A2K1QN41_9PEZI|nr:hypothetical protein CAC42_6377 [Sphaceloma murrayae]